MARNVQKRQKKLQKQKANRKAELKAARRQESRGVRGEFELAARFPVLHACEFIDSEQIGLTTLLLSRKLPGGNVAFVIFLIDSYCLGVKDVVYHIEPEGSYTWNTYDKLNEQYDRYDLAPEELRKLVEGAVEFARGLGLQPHADYRKVSPIFGDIDSSQCREVHVFGREGKPCYINGPYDSPEKTRRILATLREHCGEGNFDFIYMSEGSSDWESLPGYSEVDAGDFEQHEEW